MCSTVLQNFIGTLSVLLTTSISDVELSAYRKTFFQFRQSTYSISVAIIAARDADIKTCAGNMLAPLLIGVEVAVADVDTVDPEVMLTVDDAVELDTELTLVAGVSEVDKVISPEDAATEHCAAVPPQMVNSLESPTLYDADSWAVKSNL
jgi:hypothetical protein